VVRITFEGDRMTRNDFGQARGVRRVGRAVAIATFAAVVTLASPVLAQTPYDSGSAPETTSVEPPVPSSVPAGALDGPFTSSSSRTGALAGFAALAGLMGFAAARRRSTAGSTSSGS